MKIEEIIFKGDAWKAGILKFTGVSGAGFNELHVTVTLDTAVVGKGFHFSTYENIVTTSVGTPVGKIYYTYDESAHKAVEITTRPMCAAWGNHNAIRNSFFFGQFMDEACAFYRKCFGIVRVVSQSIDSSSFPSLAEAMAASAPKPAPVRRRKGTVATIPDPAVAPSTVASPARPMIVEDPFLNSILLESGAFDE